MQQALNKKIDREKLERIIKIFKEVHEEQSNKNKQRYDNEELQFKLAIELGHYKGLYNNLIKDLEELLK